MTFRKNFLQKKRVFGDGNPLPVTGENKKIRNAQKIEKDGQIFDSKLELYMYELLQDAGFSFEFKPTFVLQPGFVYRSDTILPVKLIPDFYMQHAGILIDTKGYALADNIIKVKMLKKWFYDRGEDVRIILPNSQKKCREIIHCINSGLFPLSEPLKPSQQKTRLKELKKVSKDMGGVFVSYRDENVSVKLAEAMILEKHDFHLLLSRLIGA